MSIPVNHYAFRPTENMSVWMKPTGKNADKWDGTPLCGTIQDVTVSHFLVAVSDSKDSIKFRKSNCRSVDSEKAGYIAYQSLEDFNEDIERKVLHETFISGMRRSANGASLSYSALKQFCDILAAEGALGPARK